MDAENTSLCDSCISANITEQYSTRLELLYSLFEQISRICAYNRQRIERNSEQTRKNWNLGSHVFLREIADERGQGHHQSMTETPSHEFTRTPEV